MLAVGVDAPPASIVEVAPAVLDALRRRAAGLRRPLARVG